MTRLLVRVADAVEAAAAVDAGADIVELQFAAISRIDDARILAVRTARPATLRLTLDAPATLDDAAEAACGAEEVAVPLDATSLVKAGRPPRSRAAAVVARLAASADAGDLIPHLGGWVDGAMIESGSAGRLLECAGIGQLAALAERCRAAAVPFGFAGGLEAPDIPRLLMLRPDVLGFDAALREGHRADGHLLPEAIEAVRALIPREGGVLRLAEDTSARDTIFVRDFVVPLSIGAYRAEEKARQRVRFSVEAVVLRRAGPPRDMRDVFSYDVILETIRVMAERAHVAFVETLAEEVAATLLDHGGIESVVVTVEKLDVIDGAVGIRIARGRSNGAA